MPLTKSDSSLVGQTKREFVLDGTRICHEGTVIVDEEGDQLGTESNPFHANIADVSDLAPEPYEDTSFTSGGSPVVIECLADLGRNATQFSVQNDGAGDFTVAVSPTIAAEDFGGEKTVKSGEVYEMENISAAKIRITWVADSAYRVTIL